TPRFCSRVSFKSGACSRQIFAPSITASVKSHCSKLESRRSAPEKSARLNFTRLKIDERRSAPRSTAFEKSESAKSFQHMKDSPKSVSTKLHPEISDRLKNVRGNDKPERSPSTRVRK